MSQINADTVYIPTYQGKSEETKKTSEDKLNFANLNTKRDDAVIMPSQAIESVSKTEFKTPDGAAHVRQTTKKDGIVTEISFTPDITVSSYILGKKEDIVISSTLADKLEASNDTGEELEKQEKNLKTTAIS